MVVLATVVAGISAPLTTLLYRTSAAAAPTSRPEMNRAPLNPVSWPAAHGRHASYAPSPTPMMSAGATPAAVNALIAPRTLSSLQPVTTHFVTSGCAVMTGPAAVFAVSTVAPDATS